jgi:PAS domain S-box-containing protein
MTADAAEREHCEQACPRVLLAGENADLRDHVRRLLADRYDVEAVADGAGALAAARKRRPDLVVTNVMPVVDGFELVRELRADTALRDVPIIALSASAREDARREGLGRGADDYVTMPFSSGELLDRAEALLRSARARSGIEAELRESEQRLRLALEAGRLGSWEWHIPSNRVIWSADLEAIHGLVPGSFPGTFEAFQRDMHPDDRDHVLRCVGKTLGGRDHHIEYRIVRPDGSVRWVEGRGKLLRDERGNPLRVVGVCSDITERKQADEAQRASEQRYARC